MVTLLQAATPASNLVYLFAAFAVSWIVFFTYAFFMSRRQHELEREIRELRRSLEENQSPDEV